MIQIDIPMPKSCFECPCLDGEYGSCNITEKDAPWPPSRPEDCPLKDIEETIPFDFELFQAGLMNMPEGMSNGDVFKAMFPNVKVTFLTNGTVALKFGDHDFGVVNTDWWNTPFKSERLEV